MRSNAKSYSSRGDLILRLWREPGAPKGGCRVARLETKDAASDAVPFDGLENLLAAVHPALIANKPAAPTSSNVPEEAARYLSSKGKEEASLNKKRAIGQPLRRRANLRKDHTTV